MREASGFLFVGDGVIEWAVTSFAIEIFLLSYGGEYDPS